MISIIEIITDFKEEDFLEKVKKSILLMQEKKLKVDIQYQFSNMIYSAIIIGKKNGNSRDN